MNMQTMMLKSATPTLALLLCLLFPHSGHCFYNSSTGRWLSRDPLGEAGFELAGQRPKNDAELNRERRRAALDRLAASNQNLAAFLKNPVFQAALHKELNKALNSEKREDSSLYAFVANNPQSGADPLGLWNLPYYFACPASIRGQTCQLFVCKGTVPVSGVFPRDPDGLAICIGWENLSMTMGCLMNSYSGFSQACNQVAGCFAIFW